jgi:hypothetical protein
LITVALSTRNITRVFREASQEDLEAGARWYGEANELARELDPQDPRRAAAVLAVLSPQVSWPRNVAMAREVYATGATRGLGANIAKALRLIAGEDPEIVVKGLKVTAFWLSICDPVDARAVVIDRHAFDIAYGRVTDDKTREEFLRIKGNYAKIVRMYESAARIVTRDRVEFGEVWTGTEVQAATWVAWRRTKAAANHG